MKKLLSIITVCILAAGVAVAQDASKKADPAAAAQSKSAVVNKCDMKNFCCMRAGRMTRIENGYEVGMDQEMKLASGARIATNGTLTDAKGKAVTLKEGEAIDMNGNRCVMGPGEPASAPVQEVK